MRKWFWHCAVTQRYRVGTNRLVLADLQSMKKVADGQEPFNFGSANVPDDLFRKSWRINSAAAKAALCLMAQKSPRSFLTGSKIDLGKVLCSYNAREFHHIYPKAFLAENGVGFHEANIIANICFLQSSDNKKISASSPEEYFNIIPRKEKREILNSAFIPNDFIHSSSSFGNFIEERVNLLAKAATSLILKGKL